MNPSYFRQQYSIARIWKEQSFLSHRIKKIINCDKYSERNFEFYHFYKKKIGKKEITHHKAILLYT